MKKTFVLTSMLIISSYLFGQFPNDMQGIFNPQTVIPYDVLNFRDSNTPFNNGVEKLDSTTQKPNYGYFVGNNFFYKNTNKVDSLRSYKSGLFFDRHLFDRVYYNTSQKELLRKTDEQPILFDITSIFDTTYTVYNAQGFLTNQKRSKLYFLQLTNENYLETNEIFITRDASNRTVDSTIYSNNITFAINLPIPNLPSIPLKKYAYYYNAQNQIYKIEMYVNSNTTVNPNWVKTLQTDKYFNGINNLSALNYFVDGNLVAKDSLFYTNNNLTKFNRYKFESGTFNDTIKYEYTYSGSKVKTILFNLGKNPQTKQVLSYNSQGKRIKYMVYDNQSPFFNGNLLLADKYVYAYQAQGIKKITHSTTKDLAANQSIKINRIDEITYTSTGLISSHRYGKNKSGAFLAQMDIKYYYSLLNGNKISQPQIFSTKMAANQPSISIFPNPAKNSFMINIPIIMNDNPSLITIFNLNGQTLKTMEIFSNTVIDTENFSNGTYLVQIKNGSFFESKKLIITK